MPLTDQIKNYAQKLVENRPDPSALRTLVRSRKPLAIRFRDDGIVPNNPRFPVLMYRRVLALDARAFDPRTLMRSSKHMAGPGHGATLCMTSCTTIRESMK